MTSLLLRRRTSLSSSSNPNLFFSPKHTLISPCTTSSQCLEIPDSQSPQTAQISEHARPDGNPPNPFFRTTQTIQRCKQPCQQSQISESRKFHENTPIVRSIFQNRFFSTPSNKFPEYEMPSVTWGVIQGRKEKLVSRVIICDYLKSLGIIPDELERLELPSTVEVMKERVEFLQKLGLTIDDINEYPLMLGCSVRKNMIPVLSYLEKLRIQRSKMGEFVKNYPQVLHASVVVELVPVVKFLRGFDVEREDIPYVLQKYPELLGFKLEGTMSTSVAYLISIGVSPRDIGPMATQYPYFLGMRVGTMIKPIVDFLVSLGIPKKIVARMLEKRAYILGYDLEEAMKPNVDCLLSFGIRKELIPSVIAQYPQILGLPLKAKLSSQQYFFSLKLKIDPEGFARVIEKMPQVVSLNQNVILKPIEFLRGRGIPVEDVAKMVVKCPQLVALRVELMKNSFYFFKSEMKRPVQELVDFPEYFTYSLESRIKPRYQRLASKGINYSLGWFLNCSDHRFEERLQADFIEMERAGPSFWMGGKLEMPGTELVSSEEEESDDETLYRRTVSL
ncbi:Transcription termination factor mterf4, chloroplastic [Asimina triloba]